jgi:hypothetical protein
MLIDKQIKQVQQQKVTRKEFLTQMAALGLAAVGVSSIMNALSNISHPHKGTDDYPNSPAAQPDGYGDTTYGGE